ncbi:MAG TPA: IclR family transcriptional regulator [Ramlibacter sp.]|nr:IclR family transcriptional regulator [Ramlibacter sp.]
MKPDSSEAGAEAGTRLSSVTSALRLLKVFSPEQPELGITELARLLGLAKSTVHRLASTLAAEGFLEQNPADGRYRLGLSLFTLGTQVRRRMDVTHEAKPHLDVLRDQTGETVHLAVLDGSNIVYLFNIESRQAIRMHSYLGVHMPAFCTSEGRALLAFSPPAVVARVLGEELVARTGRTVTEPRVLRTLLDQVRLDGYALDDEESEDGMRSIAAPIFDASGAVIAAVGMGGPVQRLTKKSLRAFIPLVTDSAAAVSARLGFHRPAPRGRTADALAA